MSTIDIGKIIDPKSPYMLSTTEPGDGILRLEGISWIEGFDGVEIKLVRTLEQNRDKDGLVIDSIEEAVVARFSRDDLLAIRDILDDLPG